MASRTRVLAAIAAAILVVPRMTPLGAAPRTPPGPPPLAGSIGAFGITAGDLVLRRRAQPLTPLDKAGRKFALIGFEGGGFEAWAYPLKLFRDLRFSFLLGASTTPIEGRDIVRFVAADPAVTTLTFTYQSFAVKAHLVAPVDDPGAAILLEVDSTEPLTVVCSFLPVLQPMWPAGLGGQYASWDDGLKAYLISEPTRKNHGYLGSPAARGISYTPAHMLSDVPNQFAIEIADPSAVAGRFIPIVMAGGKGAREDVKRAYQAIAADPASLYRKAVGHFSDLRRATLTVRTPDPELDLAFEWAKIALDGLIVDNPDLGRGLVAGLGPSGLGGRPGFGWFFGTDAYLNSLSFNGFGNFSASRDGLAFTRKWQRKDGKMAHELSQAAGYIRWWEDYPYGYIHGDTSPYYVVAVEDYVRRTGDLDFLRESWPSVLGAYGWSAGTDGDGDGLMDNAKAGLGALEFGALTGIRTDVYVGAVWVKANQALRTLALAMGDKATAKKAEAAAARAGAAWNGQFWDAANGRYAYAIDKDGNRVPELTPWSAVGLAWGLGERERGVETLARMNRSDLTTDWGVRMLSDASPFYEPLNYNYGACWPFLSGWVAAALFEHGFLPQALHVLTANARHTFDNALGTVMELHSGHQNTWPQEGVPHQGFSSTGVALPFVRGLLGLDGSALDRTASFRPGFPAAWPAVSVAGWRLGDAALDLEYRREKDRLVLNVRSKRADGFRFLFAPALGLGAGAVAARVNGRPVDVALDDRPSAQSLRPRLELALSGDDTVELRFTPGPEPVLPGTPSMTGSVSAGLRLVRSRLSGRDLVLSLEGRAGESYALEVLNGERLETVEGASFDGRSLSVRFAGSGRGYAGAEVSLRLK